MHQLDTNDDTKEEEVEEEVKDVKRDRVSSNESKRKTVVLEERERKEVMIYIYIPMMESFVFVGSPECNKRERKIRREEHVKSRTRKSTFPRKKKR